VRLLLTILGATLSYPLQEETTSGASTVANRIGHWFLDFIGNVLPKFLPS